MTSILSQDEAAKLGLAPKRKRNKYGAKRQNVDGYGFDSQLEARHYATLKLRERAGEITNLRVHPRYDIIVNKQRICVVELDFEYRDRLDECDHFIDCKGKDTALSRLKRSLLKACYAIEVELIR